MLKPVLILTVLVLAALVTLGVFALPVLISDTQYASGYTESGFDSIRVGDSKDRVLEVLGAPLSTSAATPTISWLYCGEDHSGFRDDGGVSGTFTLFTFDADGRVTSVFGQVETVASESLLSRQVTVTIGGGYLGLSRAESNVLDGKPSALNGKTQAEIEALHGKPRYREQDLATEYLIYSRSPSSTHYYLRQIGIDADGKVTTKRQYFYWD